MFYFLLYFISGNYHYQLSLSWDLLRYISFYSPFCFHEISQCHLSMGKRKAFYFSFQKRKCKLHKLIFLRRIIILCMDNHLVCVCVCCVLMCCISRWCIFSSSVFRWFTAFAWRLLAENKFFIVFFFLGSNSQNSWRCIVFGQWRDCTRQTAKWHENNNNNSNKNCESIGSVCSVQCAVHLMHQCTVYERWTIIAVVNRILVSFTILRMTLPMGKQVFRCKFSLETEHKFVRRNISNTYVFCALSDDPWMLWIFFLWISFHFVAFKMGINVWCMCICGLLHHFLINIMDSNWFFNGWCRQFPVICSLIDTKFN